MSSQWHGGKGSARRPTVVERAKWEENYHRIFGYKDKERCFECGEDLPSHTVNCKNNFKNSIKEVTDNHPIRGK